MTDLSQHLRELLAPTHSAPLHKEVQPPPLRQKPPKGWEPGIVWNGTKGVAISRAYQVDEEADHATLLQEWGFDPKTHFIDGPLEYRQWNAAIGNGEVDIFRYYKAKIERGVQVQQVDVDALIEEIKKHKPQPYKGPEGDDAFCVFFSDFQVGKGDGDGTEGTVARILSVFDQTELRIKELRKIGRPLGTLYLFGLGDLVEGCTGFYPQQEFTTDLNRRDQVKVVRRLLIAAITKWAKLFNKVVIACVVGNHGENRKKGKSYTDFHDNDDVALFEMVYDVLAQNPEAYGHVKFVFPPLDGNKLSMVLDVAGTPIGIVHGHQFTGGGLPQQKAYTWWMKQTMGLQPVADAIVLVSAHFHHFSQIQHGKRIHFQTPALDGGSPWYTESSGDESPPGLLTFRAVGGGVDDVQVISP